MSRDSSNDKFLVSALIDTKEKLSNIKSEMNQLLQFKSHSNLLTDNYTQTPLYTVGEQILNFRATGIFDGMGAYLKDDNTVNVLLNSELSNSLNVWKYKINNIELGASRITKFSINRNTKTVVKAEIAYTDIIAPDGSSLNEANKDIIFQSSKTFSNNSNPPQTLVGFERLCSGHVVEPEFWGKGKGPVDRIYVTGEEIFPSGGNYKDSNGGRILALDTQTSKLYCLPGLPKTPFENMVDINCNEKFVAFTFGGEHNPSTSMYFTKQSQNDINMSANSKIAATKVSGTGNDSNFNLYKFGSLLCIYLGKKIKNGNFLERNGLHSGKVYVFVADNRDCTPGVYIDHLGTNNLRGNFIPLTFDNNIEVSYNDLMIAAANANAYLFNRFEDVSVNPNNGAEFAITCTNNDTVEKITINDNLDDITDYPQQINATIMRITGTPGQRTTNPTTCKGPDNLEWTKDNKLYVNEDVSNNRIGYIDMTQKLPTKIEWFAQTVNEPTYPTNCLTPNKILSDPPGPSGIFDISNFFAKKSDGTFKLTSGYTGQEAREALDGSKLLYNIQSNAQQSGDIEYFKLGKGSQLILLEKK